ncbi:leucine-rich repeat domain-containing protein [Dyadobacter psychrotolerans]|nr:leucine-rich repeat domain-containing protein [Dyadobacter psychrotolerans]
MKIVLTFALLLLTRYASAQLVVLSEKESVKKNLTVKELDKQYPEGQELGLEVPRSIYDAIRNALDVVMGPKKVEKLTVASSLYLNNEGKIDYLIYNFGGNMWVVENGKAVLRKPDFNQDSLSRIISENLPAQLAGFISKRHIGEKSKLNLYSNFTISASELKSKAVAQNDSIVGSMLSKLKGTEKVIVKKDSVIKGLDAALASVDTLKIKTLYLERALLKSVPDVIYRFPNLEMLSLLDNDLEEVNINMSRLPKLKHLNLSGNILSENSIKISSNKTLQLLNLQRNIIHDIPFAVKNCKKLETLWLGRNKLSALSDRSFGKMKRLRDLNLYKARIASLPGGVKKMRRLEVLDLYYNNLEKLPGSVTKLKRLTHLAVANNQLTVLPEKLNKLKRLNVLYAHHNHLSKLPANIVKLNNLLILDLGFNWFTDFPSELTRFASLQDLDLSSNNFTEFPVELLSVQRLNKLFLRGNPFLQDDREVKYGPQFSQLKSKNIEVFY